MPQPRTKTNSLVSWSFFNEICPSGKWNSCAVKYSLTRMWANFISHCDEGAIFHNFRKGIISHSPQGEYFTWKTPDFMIYTQRPPNFSWPTALTEKNFYGIIKYWFYPYKNGGSKMSRKFKNFRDLGNLPAADGKKVRKGKLYRSGHLCKISPKFRPRLRTAFVL